MNICFPTMVEIVRLTMARRKGEDLIEFASSLAYVEHFLDHQFHFDSVDADQPRDWQEVSDYISMQLGLEVHVEDDFMPLSWLAIVPVLERCPSGQPAPLFTKSVEFFKLWDVEMYVRNCNPAAREDRYPRS